jgi:hypothetical protein
MSIRDLQPHIRVLVNALSFVRYKGLSTIFQQRMTAKENYVGYPLSKPKSASFHF